MRRVMRELALPDLTTPTPDQEDDLIRLFASSRFQGQSPPACLRRKSHEVRQIGIDFQLPCALGAAKLLTMQVVSGDAYLSSYDEDSIQPVNPIAFICRRLLDPRFRFLDLGDTDECDDAHYKAFGDAAAGRGGTIASAAAGALRLRAVLS